MPMRTASRPAAAASLIDRLRAQLLGLDELEQVAEGAAAALLGRMGGVLAGRTDEAAQLLHVDAGMRLDECLQRRVLGQQAFAPALALVQRQAVLGMAELECGHRFLDRFGIDVAHQLADVLHLAAPTFVGGDLLGGLDGVEQDLGQAQRRDAVGRQAQQVLAQRLQHMRFALLLGFARTVEAIVVLEIVVVSGHGVFLGPYDCRPQQVSERSAPMSKPIKNPSAHLQDAGFAYSQQRFRELVDEVLAEAKKLGATDAGAEVSEGCGLSVSARLGELENGERNRDKALGISVYG